MASKGLELSSSDQPQRAQAVLWFRHDNGRVPSVLRVERVGSFTKSLGQWMYYSVIKPVLIWWLNIVKLGVTEETTLFLCTDLLAYERKQMSAVTILGGRKRKMFFGNK